MPIFEESDGPSDTEPDRSFEKSMKSIRINVDRFFNTLSSQVRVLDRFQAKYQKKEDGCLEKYFIIQYNFMVPIKQEDS